MKRAVAAITLSTMLALAPAVAQRSGSFSSGSRSYSSPSTSSRSYSSPSTSSRIGTFSSSSRSSSFSSSSSRSGTFFSNPNARTSPYANSFNQQGRYVPAARGYRSYSSYDSNFAVANYMPWLFLWSSQNDDDEVVVIDSSASTQAQQDAVMQAAERDADDAIATEMRGLTVWGWLIAAAVVAVIITIIVALFNRRRY